MCLYLDPIDFVALQRDFILCRRFREDIYQVETGKSGNDATPDELAEHWTKFPDPDHSQAAWFASLYAMHRF